MPSNCQQYSTYYRDYCVYGHYYVYGGSALDDIVRLGNRFAERFEISDGQVRFIGGKHMFDSLAVLLFLHQGRPFGEAPGWEDQKKGGGRPPRCLKERV